MTTQRLNTYLMLFMHLLYRFLKDTYYQSFTNITIKNHYAPWNISRIEEVNLVDVIFYLGHCFTIWI